MSWKGKRVLIVGLGASGKAAARFFLRRGAVVSATDSRTEDELGAVVAELRALKVTLHLGGHPDELFLSHDLILPSPGVPWNLPQLELARKEGRTVAGELEIAAEELAGRVIGVTGSNGKTTTTSLIGHILEAASIPRQVGGNIGVPVLALVDSSSDDQWNVLELSSFQLEATESFRCHVALVLNVTPDHLDRHGSLDAYADAKARILAGQTADDQAVLNADDPICREIAARAPGDVHWFSRRTEHRPGAWVVGDSIYLNGRSIASTALPIRGAHNLENALAAAVAASLAGAPDERIARGLETFQPVEHRLEFVERIGGVDYYNDSKATNVDAAVKALEAFPSGVWLILGGRDKDGDFRPLAASGADRVREVLLIGEAAPVIREQLEGGPLTLADCGDLARALRYARERARPGDTVLLAPACASFDQFRNYADRGSEFKQLVREMAAPAEGKP